MPRNTLHYGDDLMPDNPADDFKAFEAHVRDTLLPLVEGCAISISICPENFDVKFAVELGLTIMLDKPLIVFVHKGRRVPHHLRRVADRIIEGDYKRAITTTPPLRTASATPSVN